MSPVPGISLRIQIFPRRSIQQVCRRFSDGITLRSVISSVTLEDDVALLARLYEDPAADFHHHVFHRLTCGVFTSMVQAFIASPFFAFCASGGAFILACQRAASGWSGRERRGEARQVCM